MADVLLQLAQARGARKLVEVLRLPVPMPRALDRAVGPWQRRELAGRDVIVANFRAAAIAEPFANVLAGAGARAVVLGADPAPAFAAAGVAFALAPRFTADRVHAIVFDATELASPDALRALYQLHALVPQLAPSGRLIVLGRPPSASDPLAAAAAAALDGFVRSAAKELGRRGITAQRIEIAPGAEARAAAIARFLLSQRSAFVTAQTFRATTTAAFAHPLDYVATLDGKVAMVTGASRGIGAAIARRLAGEGARVVCVDIAAAQAELAAVARAIGGSIVIADVRNTDTPRRLAEHLRAQHGGVDVIVHNAGITRDRTLANMSADEWNDVIDVNISAVARITDALVPHLRDGGRIACVSSVSGIAGNVGQTNYAASKAGVIGYVRALAARLAPRGITVNAVAPGFIETRMTAAIPLAIREAGRRLSALGQGGQPVDVAELIAFLAQPASAGLTGEVVRVCGGALIGA